MSKPLKELFFGSSGRSLVEAIAPERSFSDVVLPPATRAALERALAQIRHRELIFERWGLGERHSAGQGLAFNFAGPPGTGKTICAEAIASLLRKRLLVVRYDEVESQWAGATGKNVAALFRAAVEQDAVLFFDEADAIAGRRSTSLDHGFQREANTVVSILLRQLEAFPGVVIFATNLAHNFDPAFERRIRTHILFEMPGVEEREEIWRVQLHARKTPLAPDVDFRALAERFPASGGEIKNAVLKAALMAADEPIDDLEKAIRQEHFVSAAEEVLAARTVMGQSLYEGREADALAAMIPGMRPEDELREEVDALGARLSETEDRVHPMADVLRQLREEQAELARTLEQRGEALRKVDGRVRTVLALAAGALAALVTTLALALLV